MLLAVQHTGGAVGTQTRVKSVTLGWTSVKAVLQQLELDCLRSRWESTTPKALVPHDPQISVLYMPSSVAVSSVHSLHSWNSSKSTGLEEYRHCAGTVDSHKFFNTPPGVTRSYSGMGHTSSPPMYRLTSLMPRQSTPCLWTVRILH